MPSFRSPAGLAQRCPFLTACILCSAIDFWAAGAVRWGWEKERSACEGLPCCHVLCWPHHSSPRAEQVLASQIDSYEKLYEEVSKCDNTKVFNGWLQCDCRPFKQALLNTIKRWSLMFKRHLSNHVISRWAPGPLPRPTPTPTPTALTLTAPQRALCQGPQPAGCRVEGQV